MIPLNANGLTCTVTWNVCGKVVILLLNCSFLTPWANAGKPGTAAAFAAYEKLKTRCSFWYSDTSRQDLRLDSNATGLLNPSGHAPNP